MPRHKIIRNPKEVFELHCYVVVLHNHEKDIFEHPDLLSPQTIHVIIRVHVLPDYIVNLAPDTKMHIDLTA
jgi:hypothetical protein